MLAIVFHPRNMRKTTISMNSASVLRSGIWRSHPER
jgi:hypothetical protein